MRRIYESDALHRDDDEPQAPREQRRESTIQAMRSVPSAALSEWLLPQSVARRFISVSVETPTNRVPVGETVPFTATFRNALPVPVTLRTASPVLWDWSVDGAVEASRVDLRNPPDEPGAFEFGRGERKEFPRRWDLHFRESAAEWMPAEPGTYTVRVAVNVADPERSELVAETTVEVLPR